MATAELSSDQGGDLLSSVLSRISGTGPSLVTGEAGGGAVRVSLQGMQRVESVEISADVLDDREILQDLVAAAVNDALEKARAATQQAALGLFQQLSSE
ncbi:MAG: YbaB/EbfC family nucleoid-associated protein [bacterium]